MKIFFNFATDSGVLAQLARALDWQSRGQGFDPPILHNEQPDLLIYRAFPVVSYLLHTFPHTDCLKSYSIKM